MAYEISLNSLKRTIRSASFARTGDGNEQIYWPLFKERFPNCELFWREFVVPTSKRIELKPGEPGGDRRRDGLAEDLWTTVAFRHYSLFMQLCYAGWHLRLPAPSSFVNFYAHLGSACDLAEDFLLQVYLLVLHCRDKQSPMLQGLPKEEFLQRASEWYDKKYPQFYENYHSKGKGSGLYLPARQDIIGEYLGQHDSWKKYKACARPLREYRNVVVHDHLIGTVRTQLGDLVPKKEKIQEYRSFFAIERANSDLALLSADFILVQEQMIADFAELQVRLNDLWHKPIEDLRVLFFKELNPKLLAKYDLTILLPAEAGQTSSPN